MTTPAHIPSARGISQASAHTAIAVDSPDTQSAEGVDLNTVVLGEPQRIYDAIVERSRFDGPIPLTQLTENP
jgi:hypothetical protein